MCMSELFILAYVHVSACVVFPLFSNVYYHIVIDEFYICLITVLTLMSNEQIHHQ